MDGQGGKMVLGRFGHGSLLQNSWLNGSVTRGRGSDRTEETKQPESALGPGPPDSQDRLRLSHSPHESQTDRSPHTHAHGHDRDSEAAPIRHRRQYLRKARRMSTAQSQSLALGLSVPSVP